MSPSIDFFGTIKNMFGNLMDNPSFPIILVGISALILAIGSFLIIRKFLRSDKKLPESFKKTMLLITLPKEAELKEEEGKGQETMEQMLVEAEAFMNAFGGMKAERSLQSKMSGRHDHLSFEIVAHQGLISFYVVVPKYLQDYMEQHIHAQYPDAQIEDVTEFNLFNSTSQVAATNLILKKPYIFPIRTYREIDVDPLSSLTNVLSKIGPNEGAVIQYVVRSAKAEWRNWGSRVAREMHNGKTLKEAMGMRGFTGFMYGIFRTFFPKKEKEDINQPVHQLTPKEEEVAKSLEEKVSKAGVDVNIRVIVTTDNLQRSRDYLKDIVDSFSQYSSFEYGNGFYRKEPWIRKDDLIMHYIYRSFNEKTKCVLNTEEMAGLFHFPLAMTETPNIRWLMSRKAPPPTNIPQEGLILGHTEYRGEDTEIRIKRKDRQRHVYIIGKSGTGKSVLLSNMIIQDIKNGEGVAVVDPHGDLIQDVLGHIPKERAEDVIHFNPSDTDRPVGLNMLEVTDPEQKDFAVQEMIAIFYKLFPPEMIGPMFEHNMRNVMLTLMEDQEHPGTITDIPRMFTDQEYQKYKVAKVKDPVVKAFWEKEMAKTSDFHKSEMLGYLISKVGRFVENSMMRNIIGQPKSGFNFEDVMNNKKILLINLAKGTTGEVNSSLLGLILVSKLQMAAMKRASMPEEQRQDFYLYIDEFQNFVTDSIATILSEARKYRLDLTIAHQYIGQLVQDQDTKIRDAVFGNVGTLMAFRVGVDDAEMLAKEFEPTFNEFDVINVEMFTANLKLLIDNTGSKPFNMKTYPPVPGDEQMAKKLIELSRMKFGRDRKIVEAEILESSQLGSGAATQAQPTGERNM